MNQPTRHEPVATPDRFADATHSPPRLLPLELLDACGNGYTAADLARALAAGARATASIEAA